MKVALAQKLAATTGPQAAPVLLAWTAATIKQRLASALEKLSPAELAAAPFYEPLSHRAVQWAATQGAASHKDEQAACAAYLAAPSTLAWQELLSLPQLEQLLQQAAAEDPLLQSMLQLIGLEPHAAGPAGEAEAQLAGALSQAAHAARAAMARALPGAAAAAGSGKVPADLLAQAAKLPAPVSLPVLEAAVTLRLVAFVQARLGLACGSHAHTLLRLLNHQRPLAGPAAGIGKTGTEGAAPREAEPAAADSSKGSHGGKEGKPASSPAPASSGVPFALDVQLLGAAAKQLAAMHAAGGVVGRVLGSSDAEVEASLTKAASQQAGSPAEQLSKAVQVGCSPTFSSVQII